MIAGVVPKKEVAVDGNDEVPKLVVVVLNDGVILNVPKLGAVEVAPKLKPPPPVPKLEPVAAGAEKFPKLVDGAKLELKPDVPNDGAVPEVMNELEPKDVPNPVPNPPPVGAVNELPKFEAPNAGVVVLPPNEKGDDVVDPNIVLVVVLKPPNAPVELFPNEVVPKLVAGVELNEPKPEPNDGVAAGVVPKVPKEDPPPPKGEAVLFPNEVVELPKENGLLAGAVPNIPPEPIAVPVLVPKGLLFMLLPKGLELGLLPKPLVAEVPKGEEV